MKGLVVKSTGSWYDVLGEDEHLYRGRLRGVFRSHELKVTNPIAVGDYVEFDPEEVDPTNAVVLTAICDRKNYFIRRSTRKTAHAHILAANIDQAVIIVTLRQPKTSRGFLDRFLVTTESFRIPAVIIFNKMDLLKSGDEDYLSELVSIYRPLGVKCLTTSVKEGEGIDEVHSVINGRKSLLVGHSGAGKSSLVSKLIPDLNLAVSEISKYSNKGKHTTTFAEMHWLDKATDSAIIDSPGIKEIGLWGMDQGEVSHYFPEMRRYLGECQFNNCTHIHEPGCAVINALEDGEIHPWRYDSYLSLVEGEDFKYTPKAK